MTERPIVVGAVIGLLLGDVKTGVTIGVALEIAFMGVINIGGVQAADPTTATAVAAAFAIYSNLNIEEAVAIAIPVGVVIQAVFTAYTPLTNLCAPILDKLCQTGNQKGLYLYEFIMWLLLYGSKAIIVYVGVLAGAEPVTTLLDSIPAVVSSALVCASGLLGAVGMSILMRMLWTKELAIYFFLGFILVTYLKLNTMAIAVLGIIIAVASGLREIQIFNMEKKYASGFVIETTEKSSDQEEEDFLS